VDTTEVLFLPAGTDGWQHGALDMSAWAGQTVSLVFEAHQVAGHPPVFALIDEVSLGTAYSDVWVQSAGAVGRPGTTLVYSLSYGNCGAASAAGVSLTFTLPAGVELISAQPPALSTGSTLTWNPGTLAAHTGPLTITVTARLAPWVPIGTELMHVIEAHTQSTELELSNNSLTVRTRAEPFRLLLPLMLR
jgi:uncharacterized repeat protein (TIGR01451 family)